MSLSFKIYITSSTPSAALQQIRRVSLPSDITWSSFLETLSKLVDLPKFFVGYEDEEEDLVTINSQLEWTEALSLLSKNNPIRLQITPASSLSYSSSTSLETSLSAANQEQTQQNNTTTATDAVLSTSLNNESTDNQRQEREFLVQSFQLLGLEETQKQDPALTTNILEASIPESSLTQPENPSEIAPETLKTSNESFNLPVGFSPSFLENVNFVPQIFSGRFWHHDERSSVEQTLKPEQNLALLPKEEVSQTIIEIAQPEAIPVAESILEQASTLVVTPNTETNLDMQRSIRINEKWTKQVDDLLDMGFEFNSVIQALQETNGSFERALELLLK